MSKFIENKYGNTKNIVKFPDHYVNVAVTVSDVGVTVDENGKKVVPAGTILGGGVLENPTALAVKATTEDDVSNAEGVLFHDVDVTHGSAPGAMLIHGFVNLNKLPTEPTDEEKAALKQITFLR